jgi:hypothetical protein
LLPARHAFGLAPRSRAKNRHNCADDPKPLCAAIASSFKSVSRNSRSAQASRTRCSSARALDFLGVSWDERVLRFNEHARQKLVRSPTYADVAKPVFKGAVGRWRNYEKFLSPCLSQLEPFVKAFGYA